VRQQVGAIPAPFRGRAGPPLTTSAPASAPRLPLLRLVAAKRREVVSRAPRRSRPRRPSLAHPPTVSPGTRPQAVKGLAMARPCFSPGGSLSAIETRHARVSTPVHRGSGQPRCRRCPGRGGLPVPPRSATSRPPTTTTASSGLSVQVLTAKQRQIPRGNPVERPPLAIATPSEALATVRFVGSLVVGDDRSGQVPDTVGCHGCTSCRPGA